METSAAMLRKEIALMAAVARKQQEVLVVIQLITYLAQLEVRIKVEPDATVVAEAAADTSAAAVVVTMLAAAAVQALLVAQESLMDQQLQEHAEL